MNTRISTESRPSSPFKKPRLNPQSQIAKIYKNRQAHWFDYIQAVIESVCDEDDEDNAYLPLATKMNLSLFDFASLLIEETVTNNWLMLNQLIDLAQEIAPIEGGAMLDCLNEVVMAKFSPLELKAAFREMPEEERADYVDMFNDYFGDGDFSLEE